MCTCAHLCFRNTCVDTIIFFANSCACISTHLWVQIWCWCFTKRKLLPKKKTPPKKDVRPYFYIFDASPGIRFAGSIISNCPIVHSPETDITEVPQNRTPGVFKGQKTLMVHLRVRLTHIFFRSRIHVPPITHELDAFGLLPNLSQRIWQRRTQSYRIHVWLEYLPIFYH